MDWRQFIYTVAATSAGAKKIRPDHQGGRVIDPGGKLNEINDVAIAGGHIAAIDPHIPADAPETIDARGKLVVPGADRYPLAARGASRWSSAVPGRRRDRADRRRSQGADSPAIAIASGAATMPGSDHRAYGICRKGIQWTSAEPMWAAAREAIGRNREMIVGVKARLSRDVAALVWNDLRCPACRR